LPGKKKITLKPGAAGPSTFASLTTRTYSLRVKHLAMWMSRQKPSFRQSLYVVSSRSRSCRPRIGRQRVDFKSPRADAYTAFVPRDGVPSQHSRGGVGIYAWHQRNPGQEVSDAKGRVDLNVASGTYNGPGLARGGGENQHGGQRRRQARPRQTVFVPGWRAVFSRRPFP